MRQAPLPAAAIGTVIGSDRFYEEEGAQGALLFGVNLVMRLREDRMRRPNDYLERRPA